MKLYFAFVCFLLSFLVLVSCSKNQSTLTDGNGIYYWRTTLTFNDYERDFLKKHKVSKMYVRFFDVDKEWGVKSNNCVTPNATLIFNDSVPEGLEIVPTIYITTSAMEAMRLKEDEYAEKIIKRVYAMCKQNGITFNEMQLDCDWTKSTRDNFFKLCEEIKSRMDSTKVLSSTIRLHQLIQEAPPVDKGVLMVYNTGNLMEMTTDNSIFSFKDIEPYLRDDRLAKYNLPLDVAYPTYGWSVVYHPGQDKYYFLKLMHKTDFSQYNGLRRIGKNMFEATRNINLTLEDKNSTEVYKGWRIRVERPTASEILQVKNLIESQLRDKPHTNILYHLDETQLSHYSDNEINKIYRRN